MNLSLCLHIHIIVTESHTYCVECGCPMKPNWDGSDWEEDRVFVIEVETPLGKGWIREKPAGFERVDRLQWATQIQKQVGC